MKKLALILAAGFFLFSCGSQPKSTVETETVVLTVDDLFASATNFVDQEIVISGLVTHVCKHGGQRCFVMGSSDDISIRVEAGDLIDAFKQEYVGDELKITGILRMVPPEGGYACSDDGEDHDHSHGDGTEVYQGADHAPSEDFVPSYFIEGIRYEVVASDVAPAQEV